MSIVYNGYSVDNEFIVGTAIKWTITGCGQYVLATKNGVKYFLKRNINVRYPSRDLPKAVYDSYMNDAKSLENKQSKLRALMKGLDRSDHIVVENENFWDKEDHMFVTVTECITDALPDTFKYEELSLKEFLGLATLTAKAVASLHEHKVIHGDLKPKNILVVKEGGGYEPYIIDFDSSYPADSPPERDPESEDVGGSEGYQSPELIAYGKGECEKNELTYATDVFTLAIVLHKWWTGALPGIDMEHGSAGLAVLIGKKVTINKKFNVRIGDNCGATLISLLNWMLAKDPSARPTAKQVVDVLSDRAAVPEEFHKGDDDKPFDTELWPAHRLIAKPLSMSQLKSKGVRSFKRINEGGGGSTLKYKVIMEDGTEGDLTILELCDAGFAIGLDATVDEPWPEHMIEFEPADVIAKKGYAKIKRGEIAFKKTYIVTMASGLTMDRGRGWMLSEGLARPKVVRIDSDTPWPEHGKEYCQENMALLGVKSISRIEIGGEHRYRIVYEEIVDGKNKVSEGVPVNNIRLMGFIK